MSSEALAKSVKAKEAYILPVRFDATELPGLRPTIGYLDATKLSPEIVANAILERLGHAPPAKNEAKLAPVRVAGCRRRTSTPTANPNAPYSTSVRNWRGGRS